MSTWADDEVEQVTVDEVTTTTTTTTTPSTEPETEQNTDEQLEDSGAFMHNAPVTVFNPATGVDSEYSSSSSFDELSLKEELLLGVKEIGWANPSRIQAVAIPIILKGSNVIAQALHGSGKTGTFSLSMLSLVDPQVQKPQAICFANTRELVRQIADTISFLGKRTDISVAAVTGGLVHPVDFSKVQILVGTPSSILSLIPSKIDPLSIKVVVFDEADTLLDPASVDAPPVTAPIRGGRGGARGGRGGRGANDRSFNNLANCAYQVKQRCVNAQTLLFSATFSDDVLSFSDKVCPNATKITMKKEEIVLNHITQIQVDCGSNPIDYKADIVEDILESQANVKQTIIFANTKKIVKMLTLSLQNDGFAVSCLHSDLSDDQRRNAVKDFRDGTSKVLVTTNILARGFDVPDVSLVINFDIPVERNNTPDDTTFLHRVGRCGRFARKGCAVSLTYNSDREIYKTICRDINITPKVFDFDKQTEYIAAISEAI